jgi:hypothetical protein
MKLAFMLQEELTQQWKDNSVAIERIIGRRYKTIKL